MLIVDQERLEKIVTIIDEELSSAEDFRDELSSALKKPKQFDAILKTVRDTASYLCRRNLSGKEFKTPFDILIEINQIIAKAKINTLAGLKGVPLVMDTVQEAINKRLREELAIIGSAIEFSQQTNTTDIVGLTILEKLEKGHRVNGIEILKLVHQLAGERAKERDIRRFTSEDTAKFSSLVARGKIYMFQAKALAKGLESFYDTSNGEEILRALDKLEPLRR